MLCLLLVAACNKGVKQDEKVASCYLESMKTCVEYRGGNLALGTKHIAELCTAVTSAAKFSETPCPTANILSTCQRDEGKDFFYQGFEGASDLEKSCRERGGKFAK